MPLLSGGKIPLHGLRFIFFYPRTNQIHVAQCALRKVQPLIGSGAQPFESLLIILRHTFADIIATPQIVLSFSVALLGSQTEPTDSLRLISHHPETIAIAHTQGRLSRRITLLCRGLKIRGTLCRVAGIHILHALVVILLGGSGQGGTACQAHRAPRQQLDKAVPFHSNGIITNAV